MGYLHGRDRAWQMDFFKRTWEGRKSEVLGASELKQDFSMRLFGLSERAHALFASMPREMQESFWAYTYGVNRGVAEAMREGVYEFRALGYEPEPWRPYDSVALLMLQAFDQTKESFLRQIDENDDLEEWGTGAESLFAREGVPWDTTILKDGEWSGAPAPRSRRHASVDEGTADPEVGVVASHEVAAPLRRRGRTELSWLGDRASSIGAGSNNWVLAPSRSASGRAWLANDPHLELKYPPFWHWVHIEASAGASDESPGFDAIGASLPGVPGSRAAPTATSPGA